MTLQNPFDLSNTNTTNIHECFLLDKKTQGLYCDMNLMKSLLILRDLHHLYENNRLGNND